MNRLKYINLNGKLIKHEQAVLTAGNRAFLYGDALFETMHANGSEVQFIHSHYDRLTQNAAKLGFIFPNSLSLSGLQNEIKRLFHRNKYYKGTRLRLSLFRNSGGLFTPTDNTCSWLVEASKLETDKYELNSQGLLIDVFEDIKKPINYFAGMKTANSLLFVMAGLNSRKLAIDDSLILNEESNIIEASSSNIFIVKDNKIITPDCSEGCLPGIMRQEIIKIAQSRNIPLTTGIINHDNLLTADEVFLTNAVRGIRWVLAYKSKRYFNSFAKLLIEDLNKAAF